MTLRQSRKKKAMNSMDSNQGRTVRGIKGHSNTKEHW